MHVAMYSLEQRHPFDESSEETVTALHVTRGQKASLLAAQSRGFVHVLREACPWCQTRPVHVEPRHRTQGHCGGQSLHLHHQNDSYIKMGSDESHFNVSLIVRDKITRLCPQTRQNLFEEKGETKRNRAEALLLLTSLTPYRQAKPATIMAKCR